MSLVGESTTMIAVAYHSAVPDVARFAQLAQSMSMRLIVVANDLSPARYQVPGCEVMTPTKNLGFGAGCNYAAATVCTERILFVNLDVDLQVDHIVAMASFGSKHSGVVAPLLVEPGLVGLDPKSLLVPSVLSEYVMYRSWFNLRAQCDRLALRILEASTNQTHIIVERCPGAALQVGVREFRQVGGFDESFFCYGEDVDLCWRLEAMGVPVYLLLDVVVGHSQGTGSTTSSTTRARLQTEGELKVTRRIWGWPFALLQFVQLVTGALLTVRLRDSGVREATSVVRGRFLGGRALIRNAAWTP